MDMLQFHSLQLWKKFTFKLRKWQQIWLREFKLKMNERTAKCYKTSSSLSAQKKMASHSTKGTFSCEPGTTFAISMESSTGNVPGIL